jgi:hypothetical protein
MAQTNVQAFSGDVEISGETVLGTATYRKKLRWNRNALAYVYLGNIQTNKTTGIRLDVALNAASSGYEMYQFQITLSGGDDSHAGGKMIYSTLGGDVGSILKSVDIGYVYVGSGGAFEYQLWLKDPTTDTTGQIDAYLNCQGYYNFDTGVSDVAQGGAAPTNFNLGIPGVVVDKFGNVGIGTNDPDTQLEIKNGAAGTLIGLGEHHLKLSTSNALAYSTNHVGPGIVFTQRFSNASAVDRPTGAIYGVKTTANGSNGGGLTFAYQNSSQELTRSITMNHVGNVGIGTTNPRVDLEIENVNGSPELRFTDPFSGSVDGWDARSNVLGEISWYSRDSQFTDSYGKVASITSKHFDDGFPDGALCFTTSTNGVLNEDAMVIDHNGNVGIGTTNPGTKLEVNGDIGIARTAGGYTFREIAGGDIRAGIHSNAGNELSLRVGGDNEAMRILTNGNVGIGTDNPQGKLHISSGTSGDCVLILQADTDNSNEDDNPRIEFWQDGDSTPSAISHTDNYLDFKNSTTIRGGLRFFTGDTNGFDNAVERMRIDENGNVGIGEADPECMLHLSASTASFDITDPIKIKINNRRGAGDWNNTQPWGLLEFDTNDSSTAGAGPVAGVGCRFEAAGGGNSSLCFYTDGDNADNNVLGPANERMCINHDGNVGIGMTTPSYKLQVLGNTLFQGMHTFYSQIAPPSNGGTITNHSQKAIQIGNQGVGTSSDWGFLQNGDNHLYFYYGLYSRGYMRSSVDVGAIDFTGQHRNFIDGVSYTNYDSLEGLIVSANKNKYFDIDENVTTGANAIQISQSLPLVALSTTEKDKACFGVISGVEDPDTRTYEQGTFVTVLQKQRGDRRAFINSLGEGAIWVTNINGSLESGDYITTSNVVGYGQKQDSEFLANYTVAKITMDCDFEPATQPIQIIRKEMGDVNYWVKTTYENISEEEYSNLTEESRRTITETVYTNEDGKIFPEQNEQSTYTELEQTTYQKITVEESKTEQEGWELTVRQELVNVLDEHGQIQWEDDPSGATEKAYKIRYLDADGNITDEANHVYKAAFVGCTYHCG